MYHSIINHTSLWQMIKYDYIILLWKGSFWCWKALKRYQKKAQSQNSCRHQLTRCLHTFLATLGRLLSDWRTKQTWTLEALWHEIMILSLFLLSRSILLLSNGHSHFGHIVPIQLHGFLANLIFGDYTVAGNSGVFNRREQDQRRIKLTKLVLGLLRCSLFWSEIFGFSPLQVPRGRPWRVSDRWPGWRETPASAAAWSSRGQGRDRAGSGRGV